jgi:anti-sigma regulatory factor (Ser/Thr protein kinase)
LAEVAVNEAGPFRHCALIHSALEEYLSGVLAVIERGLGEGGPVIVVAPSERLELIGGRLDGQGRGVELIDMRELGRNPAWIIPALQRRLERHRGHRAYVVCEAAWPERSADEIDEVMLHEALCNAAFAGKEITALCPFDAEALDAAVIEEARRTHKLLAAEGTGRASPDYADHAALERMHRPLSLIPSEGKRLSFTSSDLGAVRSLVAEQSTGAGLDPARSADLVFAVNEIATNSIRHGGGRGELELWVDGQRVVAEVRDRGEIRDLLVGRVNPDEAHFDGLGLWLVNQMCDLVQVRSGEGGTIVRVHVGRAPIAEPQSVSA